VGLVSISGVKFTTSRLCAEKTLAHIAARLPRFRPREGVAARPDLREGWRVHAGELRAGPRAGAKRGALSQIIAEESVQHLDDLVFRRTTLWEDPVATAEAARVLSALFDWGPRRVAEELARLDRALAPRATERSARIGREPGHALRPGPA
jgi:glycerol-3-phosphate dehydrogenase